MKEFSTLLLQLYQASRELPLEQFQGAALGLIKPSLPFDFSLWGSATLGASGFSIHALHTHNEPEEMLLEYEHVKHQDIVALALLKQKAQLMNVHSETVFSGKEFAAMRDFLRRFGHQNALITSDFDPLKGYMQFVSLYRADKDRHYGRRDGQLARMLVPHLLEALAINRVTHLERLARGGKNRVYCLGIADGTGALYHAESGFAELIGREYPAWRGRRLPDALIHAPEGLRHHKGKEIVIHAGCSADLLFLKVRPRLPVDDLSQRELQVARQVAKGATYKEVARVLGIAPTTARSHIQAIHHKLQVNNKAELIMLIDLVAEAAPSEAIHGVPP